MARRQYYDAYGNLTKRTHRVRTTVLFILGGVILLLVVTVSASSGGSPSTPSTSSTPSAPSASPSASPRMTEGQSQAVEAAGNYLSLGSGFSKEGLIQQLTSKAGDGHTVKDAEFAVNYLHPDWDAQAVESAKNYLNLGMGFSRSSLVQQLTSKAGDGYTHAQAEYAVSKVGL